MLDPQQFLNDLTDAQREAVVTTEGPLLIVAGAGSGKTRVITRRVANLMAQGVTPSSILAITFTNKAAGEMKKRVSYLLERPLHDFGQLDQRWPLICTFHSLCLRILRHYAEHIGLSRNFTVYDAADQMRVVKDALKALDLSTSNFTPGQIHATISNAKNKLLSPEAYAQHGRDFYAGIVSRVYTKYQELLERNNALDFDDLLLRTAQAFRDYPEVLKELQERFQYVLIDEYQDTNHAQYIIAHALAQRHRNIAVVGDPDQSVYAWRGADIKNILDFEKDYPDAKVVRLEQNYRSTKTILAIADRLIANNVQRKRKSLWTENPKGEKAVLLLCQDEHDEAKAVIDRLRQQHEQGKSWNQMAIFYRMNALSRVVEELLFKRKIPYQIARGVEFYNRKEIKDVLAYLRVVVNPSDEVSLTRIINVPTRGIGDTAVERLETYAIAHGMKLFEALEHAGEVAALSTRAVNAIRQFVEMANQWRALNEGRQSGGQIYTSAKGIVQRMMEDVVSRSGLETLLNKSADPDKPELANVNELISSAAEYDREHPEGSLGDYLATVTLLSDVDHMKESGGAVTLMTLHAAKGLEFPVVAIVGMEEGVLPHARARDKPDQLEEERRLCFVGITRTQEQLILSKAAYRTIRGRLERTITSSFLNELPSEALEVIDRTGVDFDVSDEEHPGAPGGRDESQEFEQQFRRGQLVRHAKFGLGRIADISSVGQQTRAVVEFNSAGRKTLILQYAKLEPAG